MRTKTEETVVYTFDELSDRAKETAREWFRNGIEFDADYCIEDFARLTALIGLDVRTRPVKLMNGSTRMEPDIHYSGFCSQGDGASYSGSYSYVHGSVAKLESEAPSGVGKGYEGNNEINRIARDLRDVQRRNFYKLQASISHKGRYFDIDVDVERADEKNVSDDDVETVRECMKDLAHYLYRQLEREWEYRNSDECVDEDIRANEYEFDEDGNRA